MSLPAQSSCAIPAQTSQVALAAFPNSTPFMRMRDELGTIYSDQDFASLFSSRGQPALAPWRLALITIMQFAENLTDRQAAEAVRGRIDWKYALGLELTDSGFDFTVLSKFRTRLAQGQAQTQLLDLMLERFREKGLLAAGGRARTDSTHVLAAVRLLNRLEYLGETLRAALNDLATVAGEWLRRFVPSEWYERYAKRFERYRLPNEETAYVERAEVIGQDGFSLLQAIYVENVPDWNWLGKIPSVDMLRRAWMLDYWVEDGKVRLRRAGNLPPISQRMESPYDEQARYGNKGTATWVGYKVHLTETCDEGQIHLITTVQSTQAGVSDISRTDAIHHSLAEKNILPKIHLVDTIYTNAELVLKSRQDYKLQLVGPVKQNVNWQAAAGQGFAATNFKIDWEAKKVTCPNGATNGSWREALNEWNDPIIRVIFSRKDCRTCQVREKCVRGAGPRRINLQPKDKHEALLFLRQEQATDEWKKLYNARAGIEGTLSQAIVGFGLRRSRYVGLAKTHLQHVATAAAINIVRLYAWTEGQPHAPTRVSRFAKLALAS